MEFRALFESLFLSLGRLFEYEKRLRRKSGAHAMIWKEIMFLVRELDFSILCQSKNRFSHPLERVAGKKLFDGGVFFAKNFASFFSIEKGSRRRQCQDLSCL